MLMLTYSKKTVDAACANRFWTTICLLFCICTTTFAQKTSGGAKTVNANRQAEVSVLVVSPEPEELFVAIDDQPAKKTSVNQPARFVVTPGGHVALVWADSKASAVTVTFETTSDSPPQCTVTITNSVAQQLLSNQRQA